MRHFVSAPSDPATRGFAFGSSNRAEIRHTLQVYGQLFDALAGSPVPIDDVGESAMSAISSFSPMLATEIEAMADGAGVPAVRLAALNARTEVLATIASRATGECSTAVLLRADSQSPVSVQTWDWHAELANSWLVWTVHHPDGHIVHSLTEYGIVGKIGVNSEKLGLHLNFLTHERDGVGVGVPVHVLARAVLDSRGSFADALALMSSAKCSASSALTLVGYDGRESCVLSAELCPLGTRYVPSDGLGRLVRTNHFLDPFFAKGDRAWFDNPDSFMRLDLLTRAVGSMEHRDERSLTLAMASHFGDSGAICRHPPQGVDLGSRYATLATVSLDLEGCSLRVHPGGPCQAAEWWDTAACESTRVGVDRS